MNGLRMKLWIAFLLSCMVVFQIVNLPHWIAFFEIDALGIKRASDDKTCVQNGMKKKAGKRNLPRNKTIRFNRNRTI